jgi:hypothetical protein
MRDQSAGHKVEGKSLYVPLRTLCPLARKMREIRKLVMNLLGTEDLLSFTLTAECGTADADFCSESPIFSRCRRHQESGFCGLTKTSSCHQTTVQGKHVMIRRSCEKRMDIHPKILWFPEKHDIQNLATLSL